VSVQTCNERDHVLLAAKSGKCIRFAVSDVRVFKSRTSDGVRGMKLGQGDEVVSMSILGGIEASAEERQAYLKVANAKRREGEATETPAQDDEGAVSDITLSESRLKEMEEAEQFILTVTENGYGKRSSAYEYRVTGRGGSGIVNIITSSRNGKVVSSMPVAHGDEAMLLTDKATLIRTRVDDIRIAGRNTQGVTILRVGEGEKVVSVVRFTAEAAAEESAEEDSASPAE
jgi:DNA gyrase subunit A